MIDEGQSVTQPSTLMKAPVMQHTPVRQEGLGLAAWSPILYLNPASCTRESRPAMPCTNKVCGDQRSASRLYDHLNRASGSTGNVDFHADCT